MKVHKSEKDRLCSMVFVMSIDMKLHILVLEKLLELEGGVYGLTIILLS
jgi:hypothetical protein